MPTRTDAVRKQDVKKDCCTVKVFANAKMVSQSFALEHELDETFDSVQRVNSNAASSGNQSDTDSDAGQEQHRRVIKKIAAIVKTDTYEVSWHVEDGAAPYAITVEASGETVTRQRWSKNDGSIQLARAKVFLDSATFNARTLGSTRFRVTATDCYGNTDVWEGDVQEA